MAMIKKGTKEEPEKESFWIATIRAHLKEALKAKIIIEEAGKIITNSQTNLKEKWNSLVWYFYY